MADEESLLEVGVTLADGSQVGVRTPEATSGGRGRVLVPHPANDALVSRRRASTIFVAACVLVVASGCSQDDADSSNPSPVAGSDLPQTSEPVDLDPDEFTTEINNRYWPMAPRTRWTYLETDEEGEQLRVTVTVTDVSKKIANGVTARVVRDTVTQDAEVVEDTFDWYAQDSEGTVWYLGEDTAEFEDGEVATREGSFEAGVDGAMAGVIMPGNPVVGMAYRQEYYEGEAEDNGEVLSLNEMADVPAGHFEQALLTKDTNTIEPEVLEYKLYAPGVGPVLTFGVSGGGGREELVGSTEVSAEIAHAAGTKALGEPYE